MIAPVAIALIGAMLHVVSPSDSGDCSVRSAGVTGNSVSAADVGIQQGGPREHRIAFSIESRTADEHALLDTTSHRPRAIEHSDAYYTRLKIHRLASYTELPLFGAEYVLGERLLHDERTGFPPSSLKGAHLAVAGGLGVLFAVNTVTGAWNLWDSRSDPGNRTLRIVHSVAMLGADAGFAWAGAIGGNAKNSLHDAQQHRAVSVGSMALATAGTAIMWLFDK